MIACGMLLICHLNFDLTVAAIGGVSSNITMVENGRVNNEYRQIERLLQIEAFVDEL